MKLKYLGTAAAEGTPAVFCTCPVCKAARQLGGRNIRTRSQAIVDNTLLIDFPADTYAHFLTYDFPLESIRTCLLTHSHYDHLYPADIAVRGPGFANLESVEPLSFYADQSAHDKVQKIIDEFNLKEDRVKNILIQPFVSFEADGYTITPIRATHDPKSTPLVYLIEKNGRTLLYANDTSDFGQPSWDFLKKYPGKIHCVSLDCTEATKKIDYVGHMNLERCIQMREMLKACGLTNDETIYVLNHFSHNGGQSLYDDFAPIAEKQGFITSYDGMEITF